MTNLGKTYEDLRKILRSFENRALALIAETGSVYLPSRRPNNLSARRPSRSLFARLSGEYDVHESWAF